jgi:hypothetical protein
MASWLKKKEERREEGGGGGRREEEGGRREEKGRGKRRGRKLARLPSLPSPSNLIVAAYLAYKAGDSQDPELLQTAMDSQKLISFASGCEHNLALTKKDRIIFGWGLNDRGQLGKQNSNLSVPQRLDFPDSETPWKVACGGRCSVVLTEEGHVWTFGQNNTGQLGHGNLVDYPSPKKISGLDSVCDVQCGMASVIAKRRDGSVYVWGFNENGELGLGHVKNVTAPVENKALEKIFEFSVGSNHVMGIGEGGSLYGWGWNGRGSVGINSEGIVTTPKLVLPSGVLAVACGGGHCLATMKDGTVLAWGDNIVGQLGIGTNLPEYTPKKINDFLFSGPVDVVGCGGYHSFAVTEGGTLYTWGQAFNSKIFKTPEFLSTEVPFWSPSMDPFESFYKWIFLGKSDLGSSFFIFPVEVVFNFVMVTLPLRLSVQGRERKTIGKKKKDEPEEEGCMVQ